MRLYIFVQPNRLKYYKQTGENKTLHIKIHIFTILRVNKKYEKLKLYKPIIIFNFRQRLKYTIAIRMK